ncbi:MFS transporter [uncultured Odoribacter sp.]|uniref:MFS transporter n=1 Tax=uncultured Odoribacter sp. TaxID=876416 RepID=UPI00260FB3B0|nr:MFS transporter [uncultured Odoribacter sp.]
MENWKRKFAIIWSGQLFSILSSAIVGYAVVFWISVETRSAEVLSLAVMATLLPQAILGPVAGVYVDRWKRKRTMIAADMFVALCSLILGILFYAGKAELGYIYLLLALRSVGSAFHSPAMQAAIPLLAPETELMRISGVNQAIQSVCSIAGPALGALFITSFNMTVVMLLDVAGALIACTALLFVVIPDPVVTDKIVKKSVLREMKAGVQEVRQHKGLGELMGISVMVTFILMPVATLFPLMTVNHFGGNTYQMSLVEIVWGSGMLLGGVILGIWKIKTRKVILINISYLVLGLYMLLSGCLPPEDFAVFVILTAIGGISAPFYNSPFTALLQTHIPSSALGRVFSLFGSLSLLPSMLGLLATGFIADSIGISRSFILGGVLILGLGIISFFIPSIMQLERRRKFRNSE